jgi:hypothetical protein
MSSVKGIDSRKGKDFLTNYENAIFSWFIIIAAVILGLHFEVDKGIITAVVILVGIIGQAFVALVALIGLIPLVGPLIAQVLSFPFIWILNGIGYLVSIVAIKRGYSKDVINYRMATVTLIVGIIIGYILGKFI